MADPKFENVKKEIRSILISFQKGTSLSEFKKEYRSFIGRRLPFQDFGFNDEYSFLKAMPDAVKIYPSPVAGDYHLMGVADESIKHIQKMVCKQKASKHKPRYRAPRGQSYAYSSAPSYASNYSSSRTYGKSYVVPPRFNKKELPKGVDQYVIHMLNNYPNGVKLGQFLNLFCKHYNREFTFKQWGFPTLEECLETIPGISARNKNNEIIVHLVKSSLEVNHRANCAPSKPEVTSKDVTSQPSKNRSQTSLVQSSSLNPNAPDFFDRDFNKNESSRNLQRNSSMVSHEFTLDKNKTENLTANGTSASSENFHINKNKTETLTANDTSASSENFLINRMIQDSCNNKSALEESAYIEEPYQPKDQIESSSLKIHDHDNHTASKNSKADLLDDFPLINFKAEPTTNHLLCDDFSRVEDKYLFAFDSPLIKEPEEHSLLGVSRIVRNNLIKMIDSYPQGIFAAQLPSCYEKVTGVIFDLHSLGFNNLHQLIDAVPDILVCKPLRGSKKDFIICSAKSTINEATLESGPAECSVLFIECIILSIRKILQANPEGIPVNSFIHHYSINCTEPLYIRDLGYDNLEEFLLSIASRVPLEIFSVDGEKVVRFVSFQGIIKPPVSSLQKPADIAPLDAQFKPFELSEEFAFDHFHPVFTSAIANPGLLYIQFVGEENSDALLTLYDEMDAFYNADLNELYRMKPADIKPNTACVALWPEDKSWYRAKIVSIVSLDIVQVFYEDYGTSDQIPLNMLRYIKKDYMKLPTQAMKSRLAYLKPPEKPGQPASWDKRTYRRMLKLCYDKSLMAKVENICNDGVLALILCDTNIEGKDLYINDILLQEGLATLCGEVDEPPQPSPPVVSSQPTQNLPQIFLEIMAQVVANTSKTDLTSQIQNLSLHPLLNQAALGFTPQQSLPPMCQQFPNISPLINPNLNTTIPTFGSTQNSNASAPIQPPKYPPGLNIQIPGTTSNASKTTDISKLAPLDPSPPLTPSPEDGEIFDDDDDEYFEQLCQKNIDAKKRYVKRVKTTDGYIFHVLLYDSQPHISSGDISILIWHAKNPSYLFHKLQAQEIELPSMTLMERGNEEFFAQLERFTVRGVEKMGSESSVLLYPLSKANQILNLFGHPSATLRAKINTEIATFNPSSSHWQELPDSEIPEEVEFVRIVTDDDKMNRLCLYDLKTMREGIRCKRLKLVKKKEIERTNHDLDEEINKLNQLSNKVRERIIEIDQIISMFSERKS